MSVADGFSQEGEDGGLNGGLGFVARYSGGLLTRKNEEERENGGERGRG